MWEDLFDLFVADFEFFLGLVLRQFNDRRVEFFVEVQHQFFLLVAADEGTLVDLVDRTAIESFNCPF